MMNGGRGEGRLSEVVLGGERTGRRPASLAPPYARAPIPARAADRREGRDGQEERAATRRAGGAGSERS